MFTISKRFDFSASHILEGLRDGHPCGRLHGHNYAVEIELQAENLDDVGFVLDYGELSGFREVIDNQLDHRHLNDVIPGQPSAERLAAWLYVTASDLLGLTEVRGGPWVSAVRVSETPKTMAEYRPSGVVLAGLAPHPA